MFEVLCSMMCEFVEPCGFKLQVQQPRVMCSRNLCAHGWRCSLPALGSCIFALSCCNLFLGCPGDVSSSVLVCTISLTHPLKKFNQNSLGPCYKCRVGQASCHKLDHVCLSLCLDNQLTNCLFLFHECAGSCHRACCPARQLQITYTCDLW